MKCRVIALMFALVGGNVFAAESLPAGAKVVRLSVTPAVVELKTPFDYAQLLVTATLADGTTCDVTRMAAMTVEAPKPGEITVTNAVVRAERGTKGRIHFDLGGQKASVVVRSESAADDHPISFVRDVMPLLGKIGCNAGTCHGAQTGKNGFKLSLRGYDPLFDHRALTDDLEGRRFNRTAPEQSLMLLKTSGGVPHVGGVLWQPGEPNYNIVRNWIAQGVKFDAATPRVQSLELLPKNPTVQRIGEKQQFAVIATYPDGSKRDVTLETFIESSSTDVATVDKAGLLTSVRRGEATMLARYEGAYAASTVVVMGDRTGFEWKPQPVRNFIDELVDAKLQRIKVQLSEDCTDEEFIRRVFIDLTGLPPTADDVRKFLTNAKDSPNKRAELIDKLIGSEPFIDHWTNKWGDLLQINRKFLGDRGALALRDWVRGAVAKNMPYDEFAHALLTGRGSNIEQPTASYFKILRDPEAAMENTTQLFLAIRFNCNKCHDHPFERWTQDQYYQMAAYFAMVSRKEDPKYKGQKIGGTAVEGATPLVEIIDDTASGEMKHQRTGALTAPKFPFAHPEMPEATLSRREQAARWIVSGKNPYFARSFVNRVWSYLMGVGLIEPVDDIRAGNPPTNPELLDRLTAEFVDSGFDVRKLIRTICQSRTYQLSIATNKWNRDDDINFSHALARRLPAEVLFDAVYRATGTVSRLPGLPEGARAAQLIDSNVPLPGGFLELLGKPVRESVCECERGSSMMLGPVLAFINGPVVGDAVQDGGNRIAQFTLREKDDRKVVEEIYLSVFNRFPTTAELDTGVKAIRGAAADHEQLVAIHKQRMKAFEDYKATLDAKQAVWEQGLLELKPTQWTVLKPAKATSKAGATVASADKASKMTLNDDGSVTVSGPLEAADVYTVIAELKTAKPVTAFRLEVLTDASLPMKGPGRATNGNFVLNEFRITSRPADKKNEKPKGVKFGGAEATYQQDGYPVANSVDNNLASGWAIGGGVGADQAALYKVAALDASKGLQMSFAFDQRYGQGHNIGKFRLSYTTEAKPRISTPVTPELAKMLDTPAAERTQAQKDDLRKRYLAQDRTYVRLKADADKVPPADPRVLGAQDLTWALLNNPAFLFNR